MTATDQGDIDAHNSAVDKLIAAILRQALADALDNCCRDYRRKRQCEAVMWLSEEGEVYVLHLGGDVETLNDYLSGARQPALRFGGI